MGFERNLDRSQFIATARGARTTPDNCVILPRSSPPTVGVPLLGRRSLASFADAGSDLCRSTRGPTAAPEASEAPDSHHNGHCKYSTELDLTRGVFCKYL